MPIDAVTNLFGIGPVFAVDVRAVAPVSDPQEFIRNTDLCIDLIRNTEIGSNAMSMIGEIQGGITQIHDLLRRE